MNIPSYIDTVDLALSYPYITPRILLELAKDASLTTSINIFKHKSFDGYLTDNFIKNKINWIKENRFILTGICLSPYISSNSLTYIYEQTQRNVIGQNPNCDKILALSILEFLIKEKLRGNLSYSSEFFRIELISSNPTFKSKDLEDLWVKYKGFELVKNGILKNPNIPESIKQEALNNSQYLKHFMLNPNCPEDTLEGIVDYGLSSVKGDLYKESNVNNLVSNIVDNPNLPESILRKLWNTKVEIINKLFYRQKNLPSDIIEDIIMSSNKNSDFVLKENLNVPLSLLVLKLNKVSLLNPNSNKEVWKLAEILGVLD